jgi:hypothetical protein
MSNITSIETIVFVTYEITPIPVAFKQSLYQHLFDAVCSERCEAEEDLRVVNEYVDFVNCVTAIRYQFGSNYDSDLVDEVGKHIDQQISVWITKNNIADVVEA